MLNQKALAAAVSTVPVYVEDVFSTYLFTGTGATQSVVNGIDLLGSGGLVWLKGRPTPGNHILFNTVRGANLFLKTNSTAAEADLSGNSPAFNSNGFSINNPYGTDATASWTFRKQAKFFDVVTYTGNDATSRAISHNLGAVPGMIIVKNTSAASNWVVQHRSNSSYNLLLNTTAPAQISNVSVDMGAAYGGYIANSPTSTTFTVGSTDPNSGNLNGNQNVNQNGQTYVAYLFAHNAGGFGTSGSDNVISCGSYTGNGSATGPTITLGYEPQFLLVKNSSQADGWVMVDAMRGIPASSGSTGSPYVFANSSNAENTGSTLGFALLATGFQIAGTTSNLNTNGDTYIYIAIRRGPMKTPTSGTSVFSPNIWTGTGSTQQITTGFFPDMFIGINRGAVHAKTYATDILRGLAVSLATNVTDAENSESGNTFNMTGYSNNNGNLNSGFGGGQTYVGHFFRRAPGFFDVVCYTATTSGAFRTHNLAAVPELIIDKRRDATGTNDVWYVWHTAFGLTKNLQLQSTSATTTSPVFITGGSDLPTSTTFYTESQVASTRVAYLFATVAGVSKVGTYTGTGTTKQIDCGFTAGARFVLIKRTDSTGDWYVWDSARGIVAGNDPYLLLNSTAAETTGTDYVDTYSAGFEISSTAPAAINANGSTFIFLAIA